MNEGGTNPVYFVLALQIAIGFAQALFFFMLRDVTQRIHRLETMAMEGRGAIGERKAGG